MAPAAGYRFNLNRLVIMVFFVCFIAYYGLKFSDVAYGDPLPGSPVPPGAQPTPPRDHAGKSAPTPAKPKQHTPPTAAQTSLSPSVVNNSSYIGYLFDSPNVSSVHADWRLAPHAPLAPQEVVNGVVVSLIKKGTSASLFDNEPHITVGTEAYDDPNVHSVHYRVTCLFSATGVKEQQCGTDAIDVSPGDVVSLDAARVDAGRWSITVRNASGWSQSTRTIFLPGVIEKSFVGVSAPDPIVKLVNAQFGVVQINGHSVTELQSQSWIVTRSGKIYQPGPIGVQGFDITSRAA